MKQNIYEYFNCNNKEELYEEIKKGSDKVKKLKEFIDYSKNTVCINEIKLSSPYKVIDYLIDNRYIIEKNEIGILGLNTKLNPLSFYKGNKDDLVENFIKGCYKDTINGVFLFYNNTERKDLEDALSIVGINIRDKFSIGNGTISSSKIDLNYDFNFPNKSIVINSNSKSDKVGDLKQIEEFFNFYSKKEITGKNVIKDENEIKELLKLSSQNLSQEHFGIIEYDNSYNVTNINTIFKGGVDFAQVDSKILTKIYAFHDIKGLIIFHNHPSGDIEPSAPDISVTQRISNIAKIFNKDLMEHFIIGKNGVYALSNNQNCVDLIKTKIYSKDDYKQIKNSKMKKNIKDYSLER